MYFIAFPTSCFVKRGFSAVALFLSKQINRLKITECGDLRLLLCEFQPDVEEMGARVQEINPEPKDHQPGKVWEPLL